jgi:ADP-ribose pyrophosphatase YjhB (NUDIX family)
MSEVPPLRLGVWCAVMEDGALLLTRRSDLNVWALPGGRLDAGERLVDAAAREVEEETGLQVTDLRLAGLYYLAGWRRLNVLFTAVPSGGALIGRTRETRDNRFFPHSALPDMPLRAPAEDATTGAAGQMRVLPTAYSQMLHLRARFALRYMVNALRGWPEPSFPYVTVTAAALVREPDSGRLLTVPGIRSAAGQMRALPRIDATGDAPPWDALNRHLEADFGLRPDLRWVGLWQNAPANALELVFAAQSSAVGGGDWTAPRLAALEDRDAAYVARTSAGAPVWLMEAHAGASHDRALPNRRH